MNDVTLPQPRATPGTLALLGPPLLAWYNQPLALPRRQLRALIYRLGATSQPVARDQLCFLLWP
ncbi:MAG: hypothetical protein MUD01_15740, partial [Chloroflexaceae bacterium]|nr:hypothetical protein [Chloroflexaceae bacterium]